MKKQKKELRLTFRVTQEQYERIVTSAESADMTPAAYARAAALHQQVRTVPGLKELNRELKGIGRNLNQLTVLAHEGKIKTVYLNETDDALRSLFYPLMRIGELHPLQEPIPDGPAKGLRLYSAGG